MRTLSIAHAQELTDTPRAEWALVKSRQSQEILAVMDGKTFDIIDRRSWCYSADTEVLTERGWRPWPSVKDSDRLAIQTDSGHLAYSLPEHLVCFSYKGKMLHFKNQGADILVNPQHRMYGRSKGIVHKNRFEPTPSFVLAQDVAKLRRDNPLRDSCKFKVPVSALPYDAEEVDPAVRVQAVPRKYGGSLKSYNIRLKDWVAFLGIYVAEGSRRGALIGTMQAAACPAPLYEQVQTPAAVKAREVFDSTHTSYEVTVCQSPTSRHWTDIVRLLNRLRFPYTVKSNGFHVHSRAVAEAVKEFGWNSYDRVLPQWLKELPVEYLSVFLSWAVKGDGCITKTGHRRYKTASKQLADDMQELFVRIGSSATIIPEYGIVAPSGRAASPMYHVYESHRREVGIELYAEVDYNGKIYCAKVPGGLLYVRRHGKACWCGNSYPYLPEALHRLNQPVIKNTPYNLRRFSETPIPRRAINLAKNALLAKDWQIKLQSDEDDLTPEMEQRIRIATECFERPNNENSFRELLEAVLEDLIIGGYGTIEPRLTPFYKRPIKMWAVDGSTIRRFMDWTESTPDRPKYAQMTGLKGERGIVTFLDSELVYIRDNVRTSTPFGLGKLEVAFNTVNAFLGAQDMSSRAGSDQIHKTFLWWEQTLNPNVLQTVRRYIQNDAEGLAKVSMVEGAKKPEVIDVKAVTPEDLLLDWQQFLIKIIANAFDLSPLALGIDQHTNRATGQVMADADFRSCVLPLATRVEEALTRHVLHGFLGWKDLEFGFIGLEDPDPMTRTAIQQREYMMNALTPDEIREANSLPPLPGGWGRLTMYQMQIVMAATVGKASGGGGGGSMSKMGMGGAGGGGIGTSSSGTGMGGGMSFSAQDVAGLSPDEIQMYQMLGLLPPTQELGQQMEQAQPGILETLNDQLQQFFDVQEAKEEESQVQPEPITEEDEAMQQQKFEEQSHQESLAEKMINRRGVFGPAVNQQITKNAERGKYPRSGGKYPLATTQYKPGISDGEATAPRRVPVVPKNSTVKKKSKLPGGHYSPGAGNQYR